MSGTEMQTPVKGGPSNASAADQEKGPDNVFEGMPQGDIDFIMACINHAMDGAITVDVAKLAAKFNYTNARSVNNRIGVIRKKYGLTINGGSAPKKAGEAAGDDASPGPKAVKTPKVPRTPASKDKVTKSGSSTKRKPKAVASATPTKAKKAAAKGKAVEADTNMADPEGDDSDDFAVKSVHSGKARMSVKATVESDEDEE
ncbi:hypothetical protein EG329_006387 [Mollisiaceae sp. DMI_Dod_QoI]|nr:hypothetical protein EG329_006387 [Helotiales sp. DMI_Dod_QoI]